MNTKVKLLLALTAISPLTTLAAEEEKSDWDIAAELGVLITSGNTESSSIFTKLSFAHEINNWQNKYTFDTLQKEDTQTSDEGKKESVKTADQYTLTAQGDYKFSETSAGFVFGSFNNDEFGAFKEYTTLAGGYSMTAFSDEEMSLNLNIGPGYAKSVTQAGIEEDGVVVRAAADYKWKVSKTSTFTQTLSIESAEFNTRTISETSLVSSINSMMQMKFGFKATTDSDVADGLEKTDTEASATIVVNF